MTDRELLELAAKAAGIDLLWWSEDEVSPRLADNRFWAWNPLAEDGDALRLAFKLEMKIKFYAQGACVLYMKDGGISELEEYGPSGEESTRRAIVRAAAEIGKAKL